MSYPQLTPEQQWSRVFNVSVCHSCRQAYPVSGELDEEIERGVFLCPACTTDLTEQARRWLGMPVDAGAGEI